MRSEGCKEAEFGVEGKELAKPKRQRRTKRTAMDKGAVYREAWCIRGRANSSGQS